MPDSRPEMRIGHADRERGVDQLKTAFAEGRLDQDELETRVRQALAARTHRDLRLLLADLPQPDAAQVRAVSTETPARRALRTLRAALSAVCCCVSAPRERAPRRVVTPVTREGRR